MHAWGAALTATGRAVATFDPRSVVAAAGDLSVFVARQVRTNQRRCLAMGRAEDDLAPTRLRDVEQPNPLHLEIVDAAEVAWLAYCALAAILPKSCATARRMALARRNKLERAELLAGAGKVERLRQAADERGLILLL